jgi:predicted Zn-dependent peptidase
MSRLRILASLLLVLVAPCLVATQTLEDKVSEFELDNGMKFITVERHVAPVVFGAIVFNVGSVNEWDGITGISHLLEHMMFKGTETVGTKSYARERKYLEQEDELAAAIADLKREIGPWRLEILEEFSRDLIASLNDGAKREIGGDKGKEIAVLISLLESGEHYPPEAPTRPDLFANMDRDYFDLYVEMKKYQLRLEAVTVEHRDLIIKDELWDTYLQNGGRMLNAFTSNDITAYIVYLPANRLELWMMLESDRMREPVFREFYSERDVVAEERRLGENDPESVLWETLLATAFKASPYGRPVIGWMSDIQSITREELEAYFRHFYAPNNAVAVLVGNVDVRQVQKLARQYFGRIPAQDPPEAVETVEPEQKGERRVTVEFPAEPQVMIGYHVPVAPHPDRYAIGALISILGSGRTSRLHKRIYEELELTSGPPRISTEPGERLDNLVVFHAVPRHPHTTEEVEAAIYEEIESIKEDPPSEREIQRLRNRIDASMVRTLGSNLGIAFNLALNATVRGDWRAYIDDLERIKQVEPEEVSEVARTYFTSRNRTVATLVKTEEEKDDGESDEVDFRAVTQWIQTLPEEERKAIFERVSQMTEEERTEYARELFERMKSESE